MSWLCLSRYSEFTLKFIVWFFFFQAEDGIRDVAVTGVQTCALPIYRGEPGRDGVARDVTRALLIHALDHGLERRTLGKAAGGHTSIDVDGPTGLQRSRRLPPRGRAPRAPARPAGAAPRARQAAGGGRGGGARARGPRSEGP